MARRGTVGRDEERATNRGELFPEEAHAPVRTDFVIDTYNVDRGASNRDLITERYGEGHTEPTSDPFQRPFIAPHAILRSVAEGGSNVREIHKITQGG